MSYERGPLSLRALAAQARVAEAGDLNGGAAGVAEGMQGHYVEIGYDLFAELLPIEEQSLTPFLRYESIDTQANLPSGQAKAPGQAQDILTFGLAYQPIDHVILKLDYEDWEDAADRFNFLIGYVF